MGTTIGRGPREGPASEGPVGRRWGVVTQCCRMTRSNDVAPGSSPELFATARLGPVTLRNRFIKAGTFEGVSIDGGVTQPLIDFHREIAAGGVGMSTVAYMAVAPEGRTHRDCLLARTGSLGDLRRLTDAIHEQGAAASVQLGHAGPVANASSNGSRALAPIRMLNPLGMRFTKAADRDDLARVRRDYGRAAVLCRNAGFDAVEVHLGHNYLPSSFLSPKLNRRDDEYGGPIENRARFALEILREVRASIGDDLAVTVKLNMTDGYRGGLEIEDSISVAQMIGSESLVDAIELTAGSSLMNPMYLFKGDAPVDQFTRTLPWYLRGGFRMVGAKFMRSYPYREAYFDEMASRFRDEVDVPLILLGGVSDLATAQKALEEGFAFVAMGRALLHDPDLINSYRDGTASESGCIHCNLCMTTIYSGTHCPISDPWPDDDIPEKYLPFVTNRRTKSENLLQ